LHAGLLRDKHLLVLLLLLLLKLQLLLLPCQGKGLELRI